MDSTRPDPVAASPLTTHWNPQLDLFAELPGGETTGGGPLWQAQWKKQAGRLAHLDPSPLAREVAEVADALRPGPEVCPRPATYEWAWPSYTSLALDSAFAWAALPRFELTGLQTAQQREALAELLQEVAQHLAYALSRPSPVYETLAQVRLEFLGRIAWVADRAQRRLRLELRDADGCWRASTAPFDPLLPFADKAWLEQVLLPWLPQIERRFGSGAEEAHGWLLKKLARRFARSEAVRATSRQVSLTVLTRPVLARFLLRAHRYRPCEEPVSETYSLLWRHEHRWMTLRRRSPGLMLLRYLFLVRGLLEPGDDVGALRNRCRDLGLGGAGWRFLYRHGDRAFEDLLPRHPTSSVPPDVLIAYVQWQAESGLRQPLPVCYARAILAHAADWWLEGHGDFRIRLDPRFARLSEAHLPAPHGGGRPPIDFAEWSRVLDWLSVTRPPLDRNQWRTGWPVLRRAAADWDLRRENLRWDSALGAFRHGRWQVRPLTRGRELLDEGQRLHHCVGGYIPRCLRGEYRVFTVEDASSGAPQVTIGLARTDGGWQIDQVRGERNREADDEMKGLAREVRQSYCRAEG